MNTAILKLSGKTLSQLQTDNSLIGMIKEIKEHFRNLVIVHGGGKLITAWCEKLGLDQMFVEGQRATDSKTMEVVAAVQAGLLNTGLVSKIQSSGFNAIGLTGVDNNLFIADYVNKKLGYVGKPVLVNCEWLYGLISSGIIPVFASVCRDKEGNLMNVNADLFASEIAIALAADAIFFLSDIEGVYLNDRLMKMLNAKDIINGIVSGQIINGMIPKLNSCLHLINKGIDKIWIGNNLSNDTFKNLTSGNNQNGTWIIGTETVKI